MSQQIPTIQPTKVVSSNDTLKEPMTPTKTEATLTSKIDSFYGKLRYAKSKGITELAVDRSIVLYYCGEDYTLDSFNIEGVTVYDKEMLKGRMVEVV